MIKNQKVNRRIADNAVSRGIPVISVEASMEGCINMKYDYGDCFEEIVRHIIIDHKLTKVNFIAGFEGTEEGVAEVVVMIVCIENIHFVYFVNPISI